MDAPDGFNTLLESYGNKDASRDTSILGSSDRDPILVTWCVCTYSIIVAVSILMIKYVYTLLSFSAQFLCDFFTSQIKVIEDWRVFWNDDTK